MKTKNIVEAALIGAIYVVLSLLLAPISFGAYQIRIAESLNVLVLLSPIYGYGVVLGCFLSNLIGVLQGANILGFIDCFVGTFASAIALYFAYRYKNKTIKNIPIISLASIILINSIFIGLELALVLMKDNWLFGWAVFFVQVSIGEIVSTIIGMFLYQHIKKTKLII